MHRCSDNQAANDVNDGNDHPGDRIPFDELHRSIHRAIHFAFTLNDSAFFSRLVGIDHACAHISIDTHLLTRHRIEAEASGDLSDPFGPFGHDDELHDDDDEEDDPPNDKIASDDKVTKGFDNMAG